MATTFGAAWARLSPAVRQLLQSADLDDCFTVANVARQDSDAAAIWRELGGADGDYEEFEHLRGLAKIACKRKASHFLGYSEAHFEAQQEKRKREERVQYIRNYFNNGGLPAGRGATPPPLTRAPPRRSGLRGGGRLPTNNEQAAAREGALRAKYIDEISDILISVRAPTALAAAQGGDARGVLALVAAGRRASTLRARLRAWRAFSRWLVAAHGESWPSTWRRLLEYLRARVAEPCGRQTILGLAYAAAFWEKASGWSLTSDPLWKPAVSELVSMVGGRAGGMPSNSAAPTLPKHLAALELLVTDEAEPRWVRAFATWKLLQAWGVMRHDDHRGIDPTAAVFDADATCPYLRLQLSRTKTTGRGKRVEKREVAVSSGAYLLAGDWLEKGWSQLTTAAPHARDYLMSPPERGLQWARARELSYQEAAGWSRALYRKMGVALGHTAESAELVGQLFTEHSGRSFLPTAAMALGATEAFVSPLGGWSATPTQVYMKAAIRRMTAVQDTVAQTLREHWGRGDVINEGIQIRRLTKHLMDHGLDRDEAERQADFVRAFDPKARCAKPAWPQGLSEGSAGAASSSSPAPEAVPSAADERNETIPKSEEGFIISISPKHKFRRLHFLGKCFRFPGVHYQEYEFLGKELPDESAYDDFCRQCWKDGAPGQVDRVATGIDGAEQLGSDPECSEASGEHSSSTDAET